MSGNLQRRSVDLGFAEQIVPEGTHMCLIYTSEEERVNSLTQFILSGIKEGERCACFSSKTTEQDIIDFLVQNGLDYHELRKCDCIRLSETKEVYFNENRFDPERLLDGLNALYETSIEDGFSGARVIGEMIPEIEKVTGGERLLEYESRVTQLVRDVPITAVCQYDANVFDGATIMEILKVHPKMIVNGSVVQNPFFMAPEEYLKTSKIES